jgi:hypothetical protein
VDAYLVPASYDRFGAHSHPLTIDVSRVAGPELVETVLHELTHVVDLHTHDAGGEGLGDRLTRRLVAAGMSRQRAWDAWHAVIFASAAHAPRELVDGHHTDYALPRGLYERFGVPELPRLWADLAAGRVGEPAFLEAIAARVGAGPRE